jgi:hypothetical protein
LFVLEVDSGPILLQAAVPVLPDDTPETLHARIQVQEHLILPHAIALCQQILLAPVLNINGLGFLRNSSPTNWIGIFMMIGGLTVRYLAARTLGESYTRTLLVTPEQQIIQQGSIE